MKNLSLDEQNQILKDSIGSILMYEISSDDLKAHELNQYNKKEWLNVIDRMSRYKNVKFYIANQNVGNYGYFRAFASYITPDGVRFFKELHYSSSLVSGKLSLIQLCKVFEGWFLVINTRLRYDFEAVQKSELSYQSNGVAEIEESASKNMFFTKYI